MMNRFGKNGNSRHGRQLRSRNREDVTEGTICDDGGHVEFFYLKGEKQTYRSRCMSSVIHINEDNSLQKSMNFLL